MEPAPEVRDQYLRYLEAFSSGDASLMDMRSHEPGVVEIGSAPDAWSEGPEAVAARLAKVSEGIAGVTFVPGDPKAFQEGTVAWLADRPTMTAPGGMSLSTRITLVFHREDDQWKVVQGHFSMGRSASPPPGPS